MMTLGRTRTGAELILQSNFNPRVVVFIQALELRLAKNVYLWYDNFCRSHSVQYRHLQMARISFVVVGKTLYQTIA